MMQSGRLTMLALNASSCLPCPARTDSKRNVSPHLVLSPAGKLRILTLAVETMAGGLNGFHQTSQQSQQSTEPLCCYWYVPEREGPSGLASSKRIR